MSETIDEYVRGSDKFAEFWEGVMIYGFGFPLVFFPDFENFIAFNPVSGTFFVAIQLAFNPIFVTTLMNFIFMKLTKRA